MKYASVTPFDLTKSTYAILDFSAKNEVLINIDYENEVELSAYVKNEIAHKNAELGIGGWLENRIIYNKKEHFQGEEARTFHLGADIWVPSGTPIFALEDCEIHSFKNNLNHGDYGPTIILKSTRQNHYYLFGHLSQSSLKELYIGKEIKKGQHFTSVGSASENGNWTPHLHFQVIKDIGEFMGDYPGVCSKKDLDSFKKSCLNPYPFLNLPDQGL